MTDEERLSIAGLHVAHAQLTAALAIGGMKPGRIPGLERFIPEVPRAAVERPNDFESWAKELLRLVV